MTEFVFLRREDFVKIEGTLFSLLRSNMETIAPTGESFDADHRVWYDAVAPAFAKNRDRQILLAYRDGTFAGFFQYAVK